MEGLLMAGRIFERYPALVNGKLLGTPRFKRLAIRACKKAMLAAGDGATGSVRSGAAGGPLLWQGHNQEGRIVAEEL
jgi:hypothetical protein